MWFCRIRENIKEVSMSDFKDFLENIRRLSSKIGEVAIRHVILDKFHLLILSLFLIK